MRSRRRRPWLRLGEDAPDWRRHIAVAPATAEKGTRPARRARAKTPPEPRPVKPLLLRATAVLCACAELALLVWLLRGQALPIRHVEVEGNRWQPSAQVVAASGLGAGGSIVGVDADSIRRKLSRSSWIRSSEVTASLPDRVTVSVQEWQPVASFHAGPQGHPVYLSSRGVVLADGRDDPALTDLVGPPQAPVKPGDHPVEPQLLAAVVNIQRNFSSLVPGQAVKNFDLDGCGNLTLTSARGWRLVFGRVLTPEEYAALPEKLAALRSIRDQVDFNSPDLDYINLENPAAPAVKLKSAKPPPPPPTPTPSPGAKPSPTPAPTATPVTVQVQSCR